MSANDLLADTLADLNYAGTDGLVDARDGFEASGRGFVWRELRGKAGVNAAYFQGGVPLVAFVASDMGSIERTHRRLWNLSRVPLLIACTDSDVAALSCYVVPERDLWASNATLAVVGDPAARQRLLEFSRFQMESGNVSRTYADRFRRTGRVDRLLLDNLRTLRAELGQVGDAGRAVDLLIGLSIFVRYFEDRGILSRDHTMELAGYASYIDVLNAGVQPTRDLFESLADRFDGDLFSRATNDLSLVDPLQLELIASFLSGTLLATGQQALWPYDFSVIPPELISSVYEQLLEETRADDAAYYTPRGLVDLVLDETMPWSGGSSPVRILDPACGSGAFLTEAFRRLAYRQRREANRQLTFPELSSLLSASIFGIDQSETAVGVATLGLYLALLEEVDPPTAWRTARLPSLASTNMFVSDFFSLETLQPDSFDIVIGNPPWISKLTSAAATYLEASANRVPDRQLALAFLFRAAELLRPDEGVLGLLLPAKPLLHNRSSTAVEVRAALFRMLAVESIFDLSPLRRTTFIAATAPCAVLIARRPSATDADQEIVHVVPQASPLQDTIDGLVVSQQDVKRVPRPLAQRAPGVWKPLLWGSLHDFRLIERIRTNHQPVSEVARARNWVHGQGFQIRGGDNNSAADLLGMEFVPTKSVSAFRILEHNAEVVTALTMHRPRNPRLFRGPHVLIRRGLARGRPVAAYVEHDAAFNNGVFGIAGRAEDADLLKILTAYVNSSFGYYYQFMTSSSWGVERDFVEESEHLSLPFPDVGINLQRELVTLVDRMVETSRDPVAWRRELDELVFRAYGLSSSEAERVNTALQLTIDRFERGSKSVSFAPPSDEGLGEYLDSLVHCLQDALPSLRAVAAVTERPRRYAVVYVDLIPSGEASPEPVRNDEVVDRLLRTVDESAANWPSPTTIIQPTLLVAENTRLHVIKPDERRYWTPVTALEDSAEIIGSIASATGRH